MFNVCPPDSVVRSEVAAIVLETEKTPADGPLSKQAEALKTTPLPEDLMLNTLIPTYLSGIQKSLNLKTMELVSFFFFYSYPFYCYICFHDVMYALLG